METIILQLNTELGEVVVKGKKKIIEQKVDRLVFNVDATKITEGMNSMEVLEITPLINVRENVLSMSGRGGLIVLINGKEQNMTKEALVSYLQSLNAENLKTIEVFTNPPAKFSSQGNVGIINIKLKKPSNMGVSGILSATLIQRSKLSHRSNLILNYNSNKIQATGVLNYAHAKKEVRDFSEYHFLQNNETVTEIKDRNYTVSMPIADIKLNYSISKNSDIGVMSNFGNYKIESFAENKFNAKAYDYNQAMQYDYQIVSLYTDNRFNKNEINAQFNYMNKSITNTGSIYEKSNPIFKLSGDLQNQIITGQIDTKFPLKLFNLETGVKFSNIVNETFVDYTDTTNRKDLFNYDEKIYAAYTSVNKKTNDIWSIKLALRYEMTNSKTNNQTYKYDKLFPSVYVLCKLNENNKLSFNYSKRIERPDIHSLNTYRTYTSPNSYSSGNALLQPYYMHNIDVVYTLKNTNFRLYYNREKGVIGTYFYRNNYGVLVNTFDNLFSTTSIGFDISKSFKITKFWSGYFSVNSYYNNTNSENSLVPYQEGWANYMYLLNSFSISRRMRFTVSYWNYLPRKESNNNWEYRANLTAAINIMVLNNLIIKIKAKDIFNQDKAKFHSYTNDAEVIRNNDFQNRAVGITITYLFGKMQVRGSQKKLDLDEQNRIAQ